MWRLDWLKASPGSGDELDAAGSSTFFLSTFSHRTAAADAGLSTPLPQSFSILIIFGLGPFFVSFPLHSFPVRLKARERGEKHREERVKDRKSNRKRENLLLLLLLLLLFSLFVVVVDTSTKALRILQGSCFSGILFFIHVFFSLSLFASPHPQDQENAIDFPSLSDPTLISMAPIRLVQSF